jgi:hypothetical protein
MRILRVRHGFTTNSSSASDWIESEEQDQATPAQHAPKSSNAATLGLVGLAVVLLFVGERLGRLLWRRLRRGKRDAPPPTEQR